MAKRQAPPKGAKRPQETEAIAPPAPPPKRTTSLRLHIGDTSYTLRVLPIGDMQELKAQFRLGKPDKSFYYVSVRLDDVAVCDCADFTFRRAQADFDGCKHILSLRAVGLLQMECRP